MVYKEGYCKKYKNFMRGYKTRFVVLDDTTISYSKNKGSKARSTFSLVDIEITEKPKKKTVLVIKTNYKDTFYFKYKTVEEKNEWLEAMNEGKRRAQREDTVVIRSSEKIKDYTGGIGKLLEADDRPINRNTEDLKMNNEEHQIELADYEVINSPEEKHQLPNSFNVVAPSEEFPNAGVISKNQILQDLSKVFYETQMLSNDSPMTKTLISIEQSGNKIKDTLNSVITQWSDTSIDKNIVMMLTDVMNELGALRLNCDDLTNIHESQREMLYPIGEKVAMIELEKSPYKIPGMPYRRIGTANRKSPELADDDEEEKDGIKDDDSDDSDSADDAMFFECNDEIFIAMDVEEPRVREQSVWIFDHKKEFPWRTTLPYLRPPKLKFSIWSIIKNAIGKDLTKFSVPVYFNEPISMLQKWGEAMEYQDLLVKANNCDDSLLRIAYVSAFSISQYANLEERNLKPCNPVLGETYELLTNDFKLFCEQVSHHPPISAWNAHSKDYDLWMHTDVKSSFRGRSINFYPIGSTNIVLRNKNEHFTMNRPVTTANNLIFGTLYLDLAGDVTCVNRNTNEKCVIKFFKRGWGNKNAYKLEGTIINAEGEVVYDVYGHWHREIFIKHRETEMEVPIWKLNERLDQWDHLYHFSLFTLQLNYIDEELMEKLPCTDSRLRPDQRALENGDLELASKEKHNVEEYQRNQRKDREKQGIEWEPRYFIKKKDDFNDHDYYEFTGKYWEDRESGKVKELERVF